MRTANSNKRKIILVDVIVRRRFVLLDSGVDFHLRNREVEVISRLCGNPVDWLSSALDLQLTSFCMHDAIFDS